MRIACEIPVFVDRLPYARTYLRGVRIKKRERDRGEGGTLGRRGVIKKRANVRDGLDASSCTRQQKKKKKKKKKEEEKEEKESPREKRKEGEEEEEAEV